jgi:peptidoglycan hydrolase-like protein with peptidoglycan-binding domain
MKPLPYRHAIKLLSAAAYDGKPFRAISRGEVDGLVGPLTREALTAYQSAQGLPPTAAIDQATLDSLGLS